MEIKISAFIFVLLYTVYGSLASSNDFDMEADFDMQNDDNYENYDDSDDAVEESKMPDNKPLQIITSGQEFTKSIGESVLLPCEITGTNFVRIWRRKNRDSQGIVLFQSEIKMAATPNMRLVNGSLEIVNLHVQDAGEYECEAMFTKDNSPTIEHTVVLRVPPQIESLMAKDNRTELKNGESLVLTCKATGYPKPVISWHKDSTRFEIQGESLEIKNVKHHDAGTYKCLADNKIGEPAFSHIKIDVKFKPVITIEKVSVSGENDSETELECLVHSQPTAKVVWLKDGHNVETNERIKLITNQHRHNLVVKNVREIDFGIYTCLATNELGTSKKNISLVPTPAIYRFVKTQSDSKEVVLTWKVQSKSNLSAHDLLLRKKGENHWKKIDTEFKPEINALGNDVYEVKYTFSRSLDPGEYEIRYRSENKNGWSENYSEVMSVEVNSKHGHHKSHKKGHKHGKERQITPTSTSQPDVTDAHEESEKQSDFVKESASKVNGSSSLAAGVSLINLVLYTILLCTLSSSITV